MTEHQIAIESKQKERLLLVLMATLILSVMNAAMFNVALPQMREEFELTASQVSWVMTGFTSLYAIGTVVFGKLSDRFRLRNLLTIGLLFFAGGSLIGLFSTNFSTVIAGRILQAAGASVIPAAALIIPVRYYEPKNRGHALGMVSMGLAIGTAVSPIVGGFIVQTFHWRVLFGLTLIVLVALPFFRKYLPDHPPSSGTIDALGAGLLAALVAFLLLAITWSNGWLTLAGILMLLLLIWRLTKAKTPFIQPALFGNRRYVTALVIGFLNAAVVMGVSFVIPQLLTELNGLSPGMVGFVVFPGAFISAVFGKSAGKLADRHGNPLLVSLAMTLMFLCFFLLSLMAGADPWVVALILIAGSVGQVSMQFGLSNTVSRTLTQEQVGIGMGLFSMIMFLSGAMSTVIIGKIIDYGDSSLTLNPLHLYASGTVYSNICAGMAVVVLIVSLLYFWHFGRTGNKNWQRGEQL